MTFDETQKLLDWARNNNAAQIQAGEVAVTFFAPRLPDKPERMPQTINPQDAVDISLTGMRLFDDGDKVPGVSQ